MSIHAYVSAATIFFTILPPSRSTIPLVLGRSNQFPVMPNLAYHIKPLAIIRRKEQHLQGLRNPKAL